MQYRIPRFLCIGKNIHHLTNLLLWTFQKIPFHLITTPLRNIPKENLACLKMREKGSFWKPFTEYKNQKMFQSIKQLGECKIVHGI